MSPIFVILCTACYFALLLWIAWYTEKRSDMGRSLVNNPYVYSLSLAVYCTAWTFFGSVGKAAQSGIDFLPIYIGPTIIAPLWWFVLRKMILISKSQRITSIADFISSRYGKSTSLGVLATLVSVLAVLPYISIQLKGAAIGYDILTQSAGAESFRLLPRDLPFYRDSAWYIAIALAVFTILFGTRHLDPNERHEGLVAAVAFESIVKLVAFLSVGIFATFFLFDGFGDLFRQAKTHAISPGILSLEGGGINGTDWFWLGLISMFAVMLLPRQFHIAVVENTHPDFVRQASWVFPLYVFLINIFVIPIALAGLMLLGDNINPDFYVLGLPLSEGFTALTILVTIGGFSAATGMVIVSVIALSIMISNNLLVPSLLQSKTITGGFVDDVSPRLIGIRRISIVVVFLLAYGFFKLVSSQFAIVSIGLISFVGIAQFAPIVFGGMYWKRGTRKGALAGLGAGALIWAYCLPLPTLAQAGILPGDFVENGLFGLAFTKPGSLFGIQGLSLIPHGAFWSLIVNTGLYVFVSLRSQPSAIEVTQADLFVDIHKYENITAGPQLKRREAKMSDVRIMLNRFLGEAKARAFLHHFERTHNVDLSRLETANEEIIHNAETALAGSIGAASAKILLNNIVREDPVSLKEIFQILDQTQEILQYSKQLEQKSTALEQTTRQLQHANEQLQELDKLKADFITTVTHELRTPITSIKALAKILLDNPGLPTEQKTEYLNIIVNESERVARLINQVLDLEKLQQNTHQTRFLPVNFSELVNKTYFSLRPLMDQKRIAHQCRIPDDPVWIQGAEDQLTQVIVNLLSNAIKFCPAENGQIHIHLEQKNKEAVLTIADNGIGISSKDQHLIFEKFAQISSPEGGKPQGTGLGLPISHEIVARHRGAIQVLSKPGKGATFITRIPLLPPQT